MYDVHYVRTMPDVCRGNRSGESIQGVIGSMNPKAGCAGSVLNILQMDRFNHQVELTKGVLQEECSTMLSDFFKELREKKKVKFT